MQRVRRSVRVVRRVAVTILAYATALEIHWHDGLPALQPGGNDADPIALAAFLILVVGGLYLVR